MGLLDGGIANVFAKAFASIYLPAVLHVRTVIDDGEGSLTASETEYACRAQVDEATEAMRASAGYTDTDRRIMVLAATLPAKPTTDDAITVGGQRYNIGSVSADPANSHWVLRGTRG